jgi:hypothetical protein
VIGIGIGIGTLGYGLVFYGAQLWKGTPQSMAYAFGFSQTNSALPTAQANAAKGEGSGGKLTAGGVIAGGIGTVLLGPLGGLIGTGGVKL